MAAIRFRAFDDAAPALAELRDLGLAPGLRLELGRLAARRARPRVASTERSTASSPPRRLEPASPTRRSSSPRCELAGCSPDEALYVGRHARRRTSQGARAAGIRALLIDRDGGGGHRLPRCHQAPSHRVTSPGLPPKKPAIEPASQSTAGSAPPPAAAALPTAATSPPEPTGSWTGSEPGKPGRSWGPGRVAVGILALLLTTVFEVGVVSAFDPGLNSLAARLVDPGAPRGDPGGGRLRGHGGAERGHRPRRAPSGLRRPLRSPFKIAAAAVPRLHRVRDRLLGAAPPAPEGHHPGPRVRPRRLRNGRGRGADHRSPPRSPRRSSSAASSSVGSGAGSRSRSRR